MAKVVLAFTEGSQLNPRPPNQLAKYIYEESYKSLSVTYLFGVYLRIESQKKNVTNFSSSSAVLELRRTYPPRSRSLASFLVRTVENFEVGTRARVFRVPSGGTTHFSNERLAVQCQSAGLAPTRSTVAVATKAKAKARHALKDKNEA